MEEYVKQTFACTDDVADKITNDLVENIKRSTSILMVVLDSRVDPRTVTSLLTTKLALNILGLAYNQEVLVEGRFPSVILDAVQTKLDIFKTDAYYQETKRIIKRELKEAGIAVRTKYESD